MKHKKIRKFCSRLVSPKLWYSTERSPFYEEGFAHHQVCLAKWSMAFRKKVTPTVVLDLLNAHDDLDTEVKALREVMRSVADDLAAMPSPMKTRRVVGSCSRLRIALRGK